jgi:hypothetical protein
MIRVLLLIVLRLALCACVIYPVWRWLGITSLVLMSPLLGVALAKPLIDLASEMRAFMRSHSFGEVEGRFYSYRGHWVHVIEDDEHMRWLRTEHLRRVVAGLPADGTLERVYPAGFSTHGRPPMRYLSDVALLDFLGKATAVETLKFRGWVEREVAFPAKRLRRRAAQLSGRPDASDPAEISTPQDEDSRPPPSAMPGPMVS